MESYMLQIVTYNNLQFVFVQSKYEGADKVCSLGIIHLFIHGTPPRCKLMIIPTFFSIFVFWYFSNCCVGLEISCNSSLQKLFVF